MYQQNKLHSFYCLLWLPYGIGQTIIFSSCGFFFSSPNLSHHRLDVCLLPYFHTWCGPSANLECRSEMYYMPLAGNAGCNKSPKNRRLGTIAQLCPAISSQLRHVSTIGKNLLSSNLSSTCRHNIVNFGRLAAEIVSLVWGTPANFNGFRVLASLLQRCYSTEAHQTLHGVWPSPGLVHYIYIFGGSCPVTEFFQVRNSLCILKVLRCHILVALLHGT